MTKIPAVKARPTAHNAVLFIPGLGGSILYVQNEKTNEEELLWPRVVNSRQAMIKYGFGRLNPETWEYEPYCDGIKVFAPQVDSGLWAQDYLIYQLPLPHDFRAYFHDIIKLLKSNGYVSGVSLFGFPYDWRQLISIPQVQAKLLNRVKQAYESSGFRKIDVISHSLGGLIFRFFCILYPEAVRTYVRRWICVACPFNGSSRTLQALTVGYNNGLPDFVADAHVFQTMQLTMPLTFIFFAGSQFPFSPKLGVKFCGADKIRWFGTHLDEDGKCWDYDSLHVLGIKDKQSDKQTCEDEEDDEDSLLEGINSGKIKINKFILDKTVFSKEALNRFRMRREKERVERESNKTNLNEKDMQQGHIDIDREYEKTELFYYHCECGSSLLANSPLLTHSSQTNSPSQFINLNQSPMHVSHIQKNPSFSSSDISLQQSASPSLSIQSPSLSIHQLSSPSLSIQSLSSPSLSSTPHSE
ncbi:MAG: putative Phospholipase A2 [Streblomastix strix]|uniref:Putative Phospholipase A2 n=1 Tax=Streblomastix strix TaxID=222440 RepID=A0A5J4X5I1_9EUKA|nr:MAG: putative Phospholipase A2 [Streblomastix strix]